MFKLTRRNFLKGSAVAATLGLAACGNESSGGSGDQGSSDVPDSYPIEPEEWGSGEPKYTVETTGDGWIRVTQEGGPTLGVSDNSKLIQVGGYAFKDLNGNGQLDLWEDWRQDPAARAEALAAELPLEMVEGLLMHDTCKALIDGGVDGEDNAGGSELDNINNLKFRFMIERAVTPYKDHVTWNNTAQAAAEADEVGVPVALTTDPVELSGWLTNNLAYASTFDPDFVQRVFNAQSKQYRAIGISMYVGPQIDLASDPRAQRFSGTFGEDPALSRDMARASINGLQSTFDENGNDLGWGEDSVLTMMKHWTGDCTGEFGREGHEAPGKYSVYPGGNYNGSQLIPYVDGGLDLGGGTEKTASVMASYAIAYSEDEEYGELVGSAYSTYKIGQLRDQYGFDDLVCTDWGVTGGEHMATPWGVEDLTEEERFAKVFTTGTDQIGGAANYKVPEALELMKAELGEEDAEANLRTHARRVLVTEFKAGLFENAYVDSSLINDAMNDADAAALVEEVAQRSVVLVKNKGGVIKESDGSKPTVYIPLVWTAGRERPTPTPASIALPIETSTISDLVNVVSDTINPDADPENLLASDIVPATAESLADVDFALVFVSNPAPGSGFAENKDDGTYTYLPKPLIYSEYTANGLNVRQTSIAGDFGDVESDSPYGTIVTSEQQNWGYFGQSYTVSNTGELDQILNSAALMDGRPTVVCVTTGNPFIPAEFEPSVDAILIGFGTPKRTFIEAAVGKFEPSSLLPMDFPKDMDTVEANFEDVPFDCEVYTDSEGNDYSFAFGLNWSGVIDDDRVKTYKVAPLTAPENKGA